MLAHYFYIPEESNCITVHRSEGKKCTYHVTEISSKRLFSLWHDDIAYFAICSQLESRVSKE